MLRWLFIFRTRVYSNLHNLRKLSRPGTSYQAVAKVERCHSRVKSFRPLRALFYGQVRWTKFTNKIHLFTNVNKTQIVVFTYRSRRRWRAANRTQLSSSYVILYVCIRGLYFTCTRIRVILIFLCFNDYFKSIVLIKNVIKN